MLTMKRIGLTGVAVAFVAVCALVNASSAVAATTSDEAAAILVWPKIAADSVGVCVGGASDGLACPVSGCGTTPAYCQKKDTLIQVANADRQNLVAAHCFYVNANSHCANTGAVCATSADCLAGSFTGACVAGWNELSFDIRITPNQPLAWSALTGIGGSALPLPANAGMRVPPVPESPFIGELKCVQIDPNSADRHPATCTDCSANNDLIGQASIQDVAVGVDVDPKSYNAVGLRTNGPNNGDGALSLGDPQDAGDANEYESCPNVLVLNHIFDGAVDPISNSYAASTELTLVPCSANLLTQTVTPVTAQFLIFNEFEQRFSTSISVPCLVNKAISTIDTTQPTRSIFYAGVAGTVAGQTRISGVNGGLLGVATLKFSSATPGVAAAGAAYNLNQVGSRAVGDRITVP